jgi:hypothetical protein
MSELDELKKELLLYKEDGMFGLYFSLNRKINELSKSLNSFTLDITKDDKTFDRFQKLTSNLKDMVESADWLRVNYLKMSEPEAKEAEKSGVPLIEKIIKDATKNRK